MKLLRQVTLLVIAAATTSCSTLDVRQVRPSDKAKGVQTEELKKSAKLPGLPFYGKRLANVQETAWQAIVYDVTLEYSVVTAGESAADAPKIVIKSFSVPGPGLEAVLKDLRAEVQSTSGKAPTDIAPALAKLRAAADGAEGKAKLEWEKHYKPVANYGSLPMESTLQLVANRQVVESILDSNRELYVNGRRPLLGSGKADFTFGADQTLTVAKAEADSKTFETLLGALPVKDYLSKVLNLTKPVEPAKDGANKTALRTYGPKPKEAEAAYGAGKRGAVVSTLVVGLDTKGRTFRYTLRREQVLGHPLSLQPIAEKTELVVTEVTSSDPKQDDDGGKKAFKFSGELVPPEAK